MKPLQKERPCPNVHFTKSRSPKSPDEGNKHMSLVP